MIYGMRNVFLVRALKKIQRMCRKTICQRWAKATRQPCRQTAGTQTDRHTEATSTVASTRTDANTYRDTCGDRQYLGPIPKEPDIRIDSMMRQWPLLTGCCWWWWSLLDEPTPHPLHRLLLLLALHIPRLIGSGGAAVVLILDGLSWEATEDDGAPYPFQSILASKAFGRQETRETSRIFIEISVARVRLWKAVLHQVTTDYSFSSSPPPTHQHTRPVAIARPCIHTLVI